MDDKNMSLDFGENETAQLKHTLRRMGELIALFEVAEQKMMSWKKEIEDALQTNSKSIKKHLQDIQGATEELKEIMTEAGAARWRLAAEQALEQGEEHVKILTNVTEQFQAQADETFERLDRASAYVVKNISETFGAFDFDTFKNLTIKSCDAINATTRSGVRHVSKVIKWLYWKSICVAVASTILTTIGICFYLNGQWPWEMSHTAKTERQAGQILLQAWPHLTEVERIKIRSFKET